MLCLDSVISLFDTATSAQLGEIHTQNDVDAARNVTDVITKKTSGKSKSVIGNFFSPM